jgi:xanthosine utilization system XapX-like protein
MTRRPGAVMAALAVAWLGLIVTLAGLEPIRHDGWGHVARHATRPFDLGAIGAFIADSWAHANPRLGEVLTFIAYAPGPWHALLAALGAAVTVLAIFALAHARLPRPRDLADSGRLVIILGLLWPCVPNVGQMLCYRPFTGNYVWGGACTLALAAIYRVALHRIAPLGPPRGRTLGAFVLGVAAGLANEHTAPIAIVGAIGAALALHRRDGYWRAWTVAAVLGLVLGAALLLGAPGQDLRYDGLAARGLLGTFTDRGVGGNLLVLGRFGLYTLGGWLLLGAALIATRADRAAWRRPIAALAIAAVAIACTLLASPKQGPRLYYASAALIIAAIACALDHVQRGRRAIVAVALAATIAAGTYLIVLERAAADDFAVRMVQLQTAPPHGLARVTPYRRVDPGWWTWGDDFRAAAMRQRTVRQLFSADDVIFDTRDPAILAGAGLALALDATLDPPDPAAVATAVGARGFSDQVFPDDGAAVRDHLRATIAALAAIPGHRLVRVGVRVVGVDVPDGRPLWLMRSDDGAFHAPTGARTDDGFAIPAADWPADATATYLLRLGDAPIVVHPVRAATQLKISATLAPGAYLVFACSPAACHIVALTRA